MQCAQRSCKNSFVHKIKKTATSFPVITGILIAILPKCPFCLAAYSSAVVLCSGTKLYHQSPDWTNFISIGLAVITLLMVILNFRGRRTWVAAMLVVLGSALIVRTELYTGELDGYYLGSLALIFGVWVNGSFLYFYHHWILRPLRLLIMPKPRQVNTQKE